MKNLVLFWGWTRNEKSYQKLVSLAPPSWKIYPVSYEQLMPQGRVDLFGENVFKFLDHHNLKEFDLLGHSLGGALALQFTYDHPERVERLFLIDSEGIYGHENVVQVLLNFLKSHSLHGRKKAMENIRAFYRTIKSPGFHLKLARHAHFADLQKEAKAVKVPTTIVWGEKDHLTPLWQGEKLHQLIANSQLVVLPKMDHDWILHSPQAFWANISK